jgi:hypothetical protein
MHPNYWLLLPAFAVLFGAWLWWKKNNDPRLY